MFDVNRREHPQQVALGGNVFLGDPYGISISSLRSGQVAPKHEEVRALLATCRFQLPKRIINKKEIRTVQFGFLFVGDPYGNRTHVSSVRG